MGGCCCKSDYDDEGNGFIALESTLRDGSHTISATWTYNNNTISNPSGQSVTFVAKHQKSITTVIGASNIVSIKQLLAIISHIPCTSQFCTYNCVFDSTKHGISLQTFFNQCSVCEYYILIIKTDNNSIFGAFSDHKWNIKRITNKGTTSSFLFKFAEHSVSKKLKLKVYHSNNENNFCLLNKNNCIMIGEGYLYIYICIFKK